jgi:hypothetical protein
VRQFGRGLDGFSQRTVVVRLWVKEYGSVFFGLGEVQNGEAL